MQEHEKWLEVALIDLKSAKSLLNSDYVGISVVCYLSQQCAEKTLKAYLVYKEIKPRRTHDLLDLVKQCAEYDLEFENLKFDASEINPYAHKVRYPDSNITLDLSVAEDAVKRAENIFNFVSNKLV